jgi:hypothetical protein
MDGAGANDASVLNVLGRLHHDNRSFQVAGDLYTKVRPLTHNHSFHGSETIYEAAGYSRRKMRGHGPCTSDALFLRQRLSEA